jgi:hypothetical protein
VGGAPVEGGGVGGIVLGAGVVAGGLVVPAAQTQASLIASLTTLAHMRAVLKATLFRAKCQRLCVMQRSRLVQRDAHCH